MPGASLHRYRAHACEFGRAAGGVPGAAGARGASGLHPVCDGRRLGGLRPLLQRSRATRRITLRQPDSESAGALSVAAGAASSPANVFSARKETDVLIQLAFASNMELQRSDMKRPAPAPVTLLQSEVDSVNPSNNKRPHLEEPHSAELSTHAIRSGRDFTILDMLDVYCWGLVLDHVPVADVVRSERVSRAWQRVVRDYLPGVRNYLIVYLCNYSRLSLKLSAMTRKKYRYIHLPKRELFENMIKKMGPFVVSIFSLNIEKEMMEAIAVNCPNIQQIKIQLMRFERRAENLHLGLFAQCKNLKQLSINFVYQGFDSSLEEIVTKETLEELIIMNHYELTGSFLTNLRTNLKTLVFVGCSFYSSLMENIVSVADRLTALTRLELNRNTVNTLQGVHLLLDKTPNLELFCLENYEKYNRNPWLSLGNELPTAIGRLSQLKELRLWHNRNVTDEWLPILARGCPALRSIDLALTLVSARGVRALCQARPNLVELAVCSPSVKNEDLEACARYCKDLELLDVLYYGNLPAGLPARLSWPRARPLLLRMYSSQRKTEVMMSYKLLQLR